MSIVFIAVVYVKLVKALKKSQANLEGQVSKQHTNQAIIVQLVTATVSSMMCWIPSSAVYLVSLLIERYSIDMVLWTTTVVMPFNSVVNPIIFIVISQRS